MVDVMVSKNEEKVTFRQQFNCCKNCRCPNFGLTESSDYLAESHQLGYPALHCKACGSYPPLVDSHSVNLIVEERAKLHLSKAPCGCNHCEPGFFLGPTAGVKRYGKTGANSQRYQCRQCQSVFTQVHVKGTDQLCRLFNFLSLGHSPQKIMQQLSIAPKIYYQLLQRLFHCLRFYSRQQETAVLTRKFIAIHTESNVHEFSEQKRVWALCSSEAESGYVLLHTHNQTQLQLNNSVYYQQQASTMLPSLSDSPIVDALKRRYQLTLNRYHFEDLHYGPTSHLRGTQIIQPSVCAYAHFQLLFGFTQQSDSCHHYIEHESSIRGAALMSCVDEIKHKTAEVYYIYRHPRTQSDMGSAGNKVGWWNDRWFPADFGAFCGITSGQQVPAPIELPRPLACHLFFEHLEQNMSKQLKSASSVDALFEINRALFNYVICDDNGQTPSMRLGCSDSPLSGTALVTAAVAAVNADHIDKFKA
ncbi:hypothetical protein AHAT_29880 [Agarivorans sp. Toyoura001]|uniref:hypothetical protein n=1 Tax=Agarivorans sp. Toyoura001 TaxID=2283141 RepID=UPI0010DCA0CF|nr:hypothetical protein [Agarivorans sp. Toyoura001]GDY27098.1 hypothetical protein AHAT_29880 [Agarivorans sp. Toyoura001]